MERGYWSDRSACIFSIPGVDFVDPVRTRTSGHRVQTGRVLDGFNQVWQVALRRLQSRPVRVADPEQDRRNRPGAYLPRDCRTLLHGRSGDMEVALLVDDGQASREGADLRSGEQGEVGSPDRLGPAPMRSGPPQVVRFRRLSCRRYDFMSVNSVCRDLLSGQHPRTCNMSAGGVVGAWSRCSPCGCPSFLASSN